MVLNAAVQMLREADELKQTILRFKSGTSMLQDRNLWTTQQKLQKVYQKILILDLDYALEKKVEQDLWNVGFKQQIEALQAISKDRKNPLRSDAQAMLSWILQTAAGFYLCLLHQICTTFKLDLPFRRRASLLGAVEGWEASPGGAGGGAGGVAGAGAARYASQHCLVHLGDLARYRQQLRLAHTFYKHALAVSPHSGQPYNQLALVWWRRGRRLCAVYWHVRSLLVRAPFPPAPANLARTLAAAVAAPLDNGERESALVARPVLAGATGAPAAPPARRPPAERIDAHAYCHELLRALHYIHSLEQLDTAASLVENLNWSLTPLIATDSFDSMTLIKMTCVLIWLAGAAAEGAEGAPTADEAAAARLADALAAGALLALLLPARDADEPPRRALPALKVWLQWLAAAPALCRRAAWRARPQLWAAVAHALSALAPAAARADDAYDTVPLPEDEELQGFLPLEEGFKGLRFAGRGSPPPGPPDLEPADDDSGGGADGWGAGAEPELEHRVRARRLQRLGARLAALHPDHLSYTTDSEGLMRFEASALGSEQLARALAELRAGGAAPPPPPPPPPPPVVISEADFREKVREKRVGILKPQGSLERAREERALHGAVAASPQEAEASDDSGKSEERREPRRARVNIAMAAIMRKQEETNKQVKFVTPPPTPDSSVDSTEAAAKEPEKPKVIQPKPMKSLANLPVGRKTGGILSLKDKSGYPHLVNVDPEPKKPDKEEKPDKPVQAAPGPPPNYQKRQEPAPPAWSSGPAPQTYNDVSRMNFQKTYGIQPGVGYNPTYAAGGPASPPGAPGAAAPGQFIKLPVVNPKEIDVRTAALQKQNSRQDMFQETNKFATQGYQVSGDKMNFLNDLPPRFANQYRYWHAAHDAQLNDAKFQDQASFDGPAGGVGGAGGAAPAGWWKPDGASLFTAPYAGVPLNVPNYYSVPYRGMQYAAGGPGAGDKAPGAPGYGGPVGSFGYAPGAPYEPAGYPPFGKPGYAPPYRPDKPADAGLPFGASLLEPQQRTINFGDPFKPMSGLATSSDSIGPEAGSYSLFSAQQAWPAPRGTAQSLWSGSQSPLERLLEQQKQKKQ